MKNICYKHFVKIFIIILLIIKNLSGYSQNAKCYTNNQMGVPTTPICPNVPIPLTNPQSSAARYEWDFCNENLKQSVLQVPLARQLLIANNISKPIVLEENGEYFMFFTDWDSKKLYRYDLGTDPTANQVLAITDLGNPNNLFQGIPIELSFIKFNGIWYCFASHFYSVITPLTNTRVIKLTFGNSLKNTLITITNLVNIAPSITNACSINVIKYNADFLLVISDYTPASGYKLIIINLGNSPDNTPTPSNIINTILLPTDEVLGIVVPYIDCNNNLLMFSTSYSLAAQILILNFGTNPTSTPTKIDLTTYISGTVYAIAVAQEGANLSLFIPSIVNGQIKTLTFVDGNISTIPIITNVLINTNEEHINSLTIINYKKAFFGIYKAYRPSTGKAELYHLNFPNTCDISPAGGSTLATPAPISYNEIGEKMITLDVFDASNNLLNSYISKVNMDNTAIISKQKEAFTCVGSSIQFVNESLGNFSNIASWTWNFGDSTPNSGLEAPTHTYTSGGIYNVTLTATSISGCTSTQTKQVKISSGITAAFNNVANACVGQKINFQDQTIFSVLPADIVTGYYWNFGDGTYSPFPNPEKTYTTNGTYTIKLDVKDKGGCISTISKTIQIISAPIANFNMPLTACVGENIALTDTSIGILTQWNWAFEGAGVSILRNPSVKFDIEGLYDITLTVRSASNCETKITKEIRILPIQTIDFSFQERIRDNKEILFTSLSNITNTNNTFSWDFGDGTPTTNALNPTHIYAQEGFYNVTLQLFNTNGCNQKMIKNIFAGTQITDIELEKLVLKDQNTNKIVEISVKNLGNIPVDTFSVNIYADDKFLFTEKITANMVVNSSKIITLNTTILSQDLGKASFICAKIIRIDANLTNNTVCNSLVNEFVVFEPFPNPAQNKITLRYFLPENNINNSSINFIIYDMTGKQIQQSSLSSKGVNNIEYDISTFANGMYVFSFEYEGKVIRKKVAIN